ncbi:unnamed protein product [Vicia faba]|uniref:Uncharacterized protein n=1 Tax=Vicia faba TaxID=3906 RepID=A0AAV1AU86_VICFA|nr:unnamed protein product [Vicia faba]
MLKDRGYSIPSTEIELSLEEFRQVHGQSPDVDRLRFTASHSTDPSKRFLVIFSGPGKITNQALKVVHTLSFKVEIFQITDLLVNITKHVLKPKHQILTDKQKRNLLKKYDIQEKQLPRMLQTDAIARYYGLQRGQITSQALKAVDLLSFKVEIFQITDLLVNITKHVLKPKHQILTDKQKRNLLKKYDIQEKQLPRMLQTDAIARYYGLQRGQNSNEFSVEFKCCIMHKFITVEL